jgi:hypothetical protein
VYGLFGWIGICFSGGAVARRLKEEPILYQQSTFFENQKNNYKIREVAMAMAMGL